MTSRISCTSQRVISSRVIAVLSLCLITLSGLSQIQAQNTISTIAGGGSQAGPATGNNADIAGPSNVVVDGQGNIYTVAPSTHQVFKIDTSGNITPFAGEGWAVENPKALDGQPALSGSLNGPVGLAIDSKGDIIIADTQDYLIRIVKTDGTMTTVAGSGHYCSPSTASCGDNQTANQSSCLLAVPNGVATDASGNVYIADTGDNRIRAVNMQSTTIKVFGRTIQPGFITTVAGTGVACSPSTSSCGDNGPATSAELNSPNSIVIDPLGYLIIADSGDHRIRAVTPSGEIVAYVGTGVRCNSGSCGDGGPALSATLANPWQLWEDSAHNLYIPDAPNDRVRKVVPGSNPPTTATISTIAGNGLACSSNNIGASFCGDGGPATSAYLNTPRGFFGDASGNYYIADTGDQRIRQMNKAKGQILTYEGGGLGDGPATSAIFGDDRDVVVDNSGNLYIADTANNRIRKLSGGTVSTIAGNGVANYVDGPAATANLNAPDGVALDSLGNVYIADTANLVVRVLNTQSSPITIAGVPIQPGSVGTVAGSGQSCNPTSSCGDGGPSTKASFMQPTTVALDGLGNFYVADQYANRVREVNIASGTISTLAGTTQLFPQTNSNACPNPTNFASCGDGGPASSSWLNLPFGVAADSAGNVFINDSGDNRVRVVDGTGQYCGTVGNICAFAFNGQPGFGPDGVAALANSYIFPMYVALDSRDDVFVSGSSLYYVVQRIDASTSPIVNPVASVAGWPGSPKYYGYCDSNCSSNNGHAALGAFLNNNGIAIDSNDDLFIADGGNNRIREVSSPPSQGLVPVLKFSTNSLTFPAEPIGQQSSPMQFTISNVGSDDLIFQPPQVTGPFTLANSNPCSPGNLIAPDTNCTFSVTFTPTGYGTENGKIIFNDNDYNSASQTVYLSGSGPGYTMAANPTSLTIARGNQGTSTITITPVGGFNQQINFTVYYCPANVSCTMNPQSITPPGQTQSVLTVNVGSNANVGNYNLIVGGSGALNNSITVPLTIQ